MSADATGVPVTHARPFSNGTDYTLWREGNCDRCVAVSCGLAQELRRAYWSNGEIDIAVSQSFGGITNASNDWVTLPRQCGRFEVGPTCERRAFGHSMNRCGKTATTTVTEGGFTYAACASCAGETQKR